MEQPQEVSATSLPPATVPAASEIQTQTQAQSRKRSRPDDEADSPTDASPQPTVRSTASPAPRPIKEPSLQLAAKAANGGGRRPSFSANGSASTHSLPESSSESLSLSASVPSLSTGPRGRHSPPHMSSSPSHAPDSPVDATDDGDGGSDGHLEEQEALAQAEEGSIVIDNDDLGTDDGYGTDSNTTASTSLAESVRDYIFENGRRYHRFREGRYNFPNDDIEQQREDMKHAVVKMLCGQLYFAPIGNHPHEILDIGTGTGIWAIEMGDLFPSSNILGVDLSPIQPEWVPPNVRFMVDDVESPWLHPRNYFDYIHTRHTVQGIKDWPRLMRRALEHIRPGGWFEMQEVVHYPISINGTMPADHPVAQYWALVTEGLAHLGINFQAAANGRLADQMRDAGFVNVTERVLQIPVGTWAKNRVLKTVGLYWRTILIDGIQAIALGPLTRGCGWTREQVEVFLVEVRKAYCDNTVLAYMPLHVVVGQKPLDY